MAIASHTRETRSQNVVVRFSPRERRLLEGAARARGTRSLSDFVRSIALREAAQLAALDIQDEIVDVIERQIRQARTGNVLKGLA